MLPIFTLMQQIGNVSESEMYRTFNMGVGMVIVCSPVDADTIRFTPVGRARIVIGSGKWLRTARRLDCLSFRSSICLGLSRRS